MGDLNGANWLLMSEYERNQLKGAMLELDLSRIERRILSWMLTNDQSCDTVQVHNNG